MAEVAAGLIAAEQVISTGIEAAVAVAVAKPTKPPKATLTRIAQSSKEDSGLGLGRAHHSVTILGDKAHIFGGEQANGKLCSADVHVLSLPSKSSATQGTDYKCYPAFPLQEAGTGERYVPAPRAQHAACARGKFMVVHGGFGEDHEPLGMEEASQLWLWDSEHLNWAKVRGETQIGKTLAPRFGHHLFADEPQDFLVMVGGRNSPDKNVPASRETWMYTFDTLAWTALPDVPAAPLAAAYADSTLYVVSRDEDGNLGGAVHYLRMGATARDREYSGALKWETVSFPANPLAPGPKPRVGGALVPVDMGMGRKFLLYFFGRQTGDEKEDESPLYSDIWALQLPTHGVSAAAAKDAVRERLPGAASGEFSWSEVEIVPTEQTAPEGKVHPGPRTCFGVDVCRDGQGVFFWGGSDAKSEHQADGWLIKIS